MTALASAIDPQSADFARNTEAMRALVADLRTGSPPDFATISVALQAVRRLAN